MKAYVYEKYGAPEVLECREIEKPTPSPDAVVVKVSSVSMNPADWHRMRGEPRFARMVFGLRKPKSPVIGADIAGRIESVGSEVSEFKPGDEVYGDISTGGFAEYAVANPAVLARKPGEMSFDEAAAIPIAALTALQGLRDHGHIKAGQKVLINGASGGVGTFAVQIAKSFGAEVTGVCSTRNADLVRSIGADHVIDYTKENFTAGGERYDLILDAVGNHPSVDLVGSLRPGGTCVVVGFTNMRLMLQTRMRGPRIARRVGKRMESFTAHSDREDLETLNRLFEEGKLKPVIEKTCPFEELPQALGYVEEGHAHGKVVVAVNGSH